jgi:CRISPR/Cas system-associated endonuclease/helicase Cas3
MSNDKFKQFSQWKQEPGPNKTVFIVVRMTRHILFLTCHQKKLMSLPPSNKNSWNTRAKELQPVLKAIIFIFNTISKSDVIMQCFKHFENSKIILMSLHYSFFFDDSKHSTFNFSFKINYYWSWQIWKTCNLMSN